MINPTSAEALYSINRDPDLQARLLGLHVLSTRGGREGAVALANMVDKITQGQLTTRDGAEIPLLLFPVKRGKLWPNFIECADLYTASQARFAATDLTNPLTGEQLRWIGAGTSNFDGNKSVNLHFSMEMVYLGGSVVSSVDGFNYTTWFDAQGYTNVRDSDNRTFQQVNVTALLRGIRFN